MWKHIKRDASKLKLSFTSLPPWRLGRRTISAIAISILSNLHPPSPPPKLGLSISHIGSVEDGINHAKCLMKSKGMSNERPHSEKQSATHPQDIAVSSYSY